MRLGVPVPAPSSTRTTTRAAAALLAAGLLLGTAACSSDDEPGAESSPAVSATPTPGAELETELVTASAPEGFELQEAGDPDAIVASGPSGSAVTIVAVDAPGEAPTLERQGEIALDGLGGKFELQDPVEVDGVEMWHASGKESKGIATDVYGAVVDEKSVRLTIRLDGDTYSSDEMDAARQQVLDSWTWND